MKVYLVYLKIDVNLYRQLKNLLGNNHDRFTMNGRFMIGPYAYTNKKSLLKDFMSYRSSCKENYILKTVNMDKGEYDELDVTFGESCEISVHSFDYPDPKSKNKKIDIVTTTNEYLQSTGLVGFGPENFYEMFTIRYSFLPQYIFKQEYQDALDILQYDDFCVVNDLIQVSEEKREYVEYSVYGFNISTKGKKWINFQDNEAMLFMSFFYPIIGGYDGYEDILFYDSWR